MPGAVAGGDPPPAGMTNISPGRVSFAMSLPRPRGSAPVAPASAAVVTALLLVPPISPPGATPAPDAGLAAAERMPARCRRSSRKASQHVLPESGARPLEGPREERTLDPALYGGTSPSTTSTWTSCRRRCARRALAAPDRWAYTDTLRKAGVSASTMGALPFEILELAQKLRGDFRLWRIAPDSTVRSWIEQRIIDDAGLLGHNSPTARTRTTRRSTTTAGSATPERLPDGQPLPLPLRVAVRAVAHQAADVFAAMKGQPRVFPNLRVAVLEYLQHELLASSTRCSDRQGDAVPAGDDERPAEGLRGGALAAGAEMLRDMWWTAWVTSGQTVQQPPR